MRIFSCSLSQTLVVPALSLTTALIGMAVGVLAGGPASAVGLAQRYDGVVVQVIDGDTVEVELEVYRLGVRVFRVTERLRLDGVQAPELRRPSCDAERQAGQAARDWLDATITGQRLAVLISGPDKYGRALGDVILPDGRLASTALIEAGYAAPWDGRGADKPEFCS
jgi:micrococcal nuclease